MKVERNIVWCHGCTIDLVKGKLTITLLPDDDYSAAVWFETLADELEGDTGPVQITIPIREEGKPFNMTRG